MMPGAKMRTAKIVGAVLVAAFAAASAGCTMKAPTPVPPPVTVQPEVPS